MSSAAAAAKAAGELGGPVALKGIAPGVVHKAQAGAVRLGLSGPTAVRRAAQEVAETLEAAGTPVEDFLVQRMVGSGVEMLVGVLADERFGPVVACGAGGGTAEVLGDVAVRLAPLAREEALRHDPLACARSPCSSAPTRTSTRWPTSPCGSARWPTPIRRSPSSTSTR